MRTASLAPSLTSACERWPARTAIADRGGTLTFEDLGVRIRSLAAGYGRLGIKPGDRVVCQFPNGREFVVALGAARASAAIHVGVDRDLTGPELARIARHTEAAALLVEPTPQAPDVDAVTTAVRQASPHTRIVVGGACAGLGDATLADLLETPGGGVQRTPIEPGETALLLLTSGTTGEPKGIRWTLPALWSGMEYFAASYSPGPEDVHLICLPMAHGFGLKMGLIGLLTGGRVVLMDRFSPEAALELVGKEQVSVLPGTPAHFQLLLDRLDPSRHDVGSLRWTATAASTMPISLLQRIYGELGVEMLSLYGCSEGFNVSTTRPADIVQGSVGANVHRGPEGTPPDGRVAIRDPDGPSFLATGEIGEIAFGARQPVRYWRAPDAATDGWYRTGDLGRIDEHGRLFVLGRLKELINRGGLKVAPAEVEAVLTRHPGVADAAVVARRDAVLGEAICACVVPSTGERPRLAELREFLGHHLARHKLPDEVCVVDRIPRSRIGKVDRQALARSAPQPDTPRERQRG